MIRERGTIDKRTGDDDKTTGDDDKTTGDDDKTTGATKAEQRMMTEISNDDRAVGRGEVGGGGNNDTAGSGQGQSRGTIGDSDTAGRTITQQGRQ